MRTQQQLYRVFKLFKDHKDGYYLFEIEELQSDCHGWNASGEIAVQTERFEEEDGYWKDP